MTLGKQQLACLCVLWLSACASTSGPERDAGLVPLTYEEVKALFLTPIHHDTWPNGDRGEGMFNADGTVSYTYMPKSGRPNSDTGHWTVKEPNISCVTWTKWKGSCAEWFKDPNGGYTARDMKDKGTVHVTVEQKS